MGKAIEVCHRQLGLKAPAESRGERDERSLGAKDQRARRPRPTIVASEPVMMKRPAEGPAVRQRPRNPTMAPGEPRVMKRPIEANAPRSQRRPAPTITLDEPAVTGKKRSPEAINTRPPRLRETAMPFGKPVGMKRRVEPTVAAPRREGPTITHGDRIAMDLMKPGPAIPVTGAGPGGSQPMMLAKPGSELPGQPKPALPATTLVGKSRKGLMTGVTFLLDHGAPPPPEDSPDTTLTVRARWSFERELRRGLRVLILAVVLGGGWLVFVPLAGGGVGPGHLVGQSNVTQI